MAVVSAVAVAVGERMVVGEGGVLVLAPLVPLLPLAAEPALHGGPPPETPSAPPSYPHRCRSRGRHLSAAGTRSTGFGALYCCALASTSLVAAQVRARVCTVSS